MKESELKPCPFCGGEATMHLGRARVGDYRQSCIIVCLECGCALESNETGDSCGKQWNDRTEVKITCSQTL